MQKLRLPLSEIEKAWLAGFVDGEGTIALNIREGHGLVPKFQIANTDKDVLLTIKEMLYCGGVSPSKRSDTTKRECWTFSSQTMDDIEYILDLILPYLRVKKTQAEILLIFLDEHIWRAKTTEIEMEMFWKLRELNKKGRRELF
jgi:hypothetical protein